MAVAPQFVAARPEFSTSALSDDLSITVVATQSGHQITKAEKEPTTPPLPRSKEQDSLQTKAHHDSTHPMVSSSIAFADNSRPTFRLIQKNELSQVAKQWLDIGRRRLRSQEKAKPNLPAGDDCSRLISAASRSRSSRQPAISYETLITESLSKSKRGQLTHKAIVKYILDKYRWYKRNRHDGWQGHIFHELYSSSSFEAVLVRRVGRKMERVEWKMTAQKLAQLAPTLSHSDNPPTIPQADSTTLVTSIVSELQGSPLLAELEACGPSSTAIAPVVERPVPLVPAPSSLSRRASAVLESPYDPWTLISGPGNHQKSLQSGGTSRGPRNLANTILGNQSFRNNQTQPNEENAPISAQERKEDLTLIVSRLTPQQNSAAPNLRKSSVTTGHNGDSGSIKQSNGSTNRAQGGSSRIRNESSINSPGAPSSDRSSSKDTGGSGQGDNFQGQDDDENGDNRKRKRSRKSKDAPSRRNFACIYHKHDPRVYGFASPRYNICQKTGYDNMSNLRRHLARVHDDFVCGTCLSFFADEQSEKNCNHPREMRPNPSPSNAWYDMYQAKFPGERLPQNHHWENLANSSATANHACEHDDLSDIQWNLALQNMVAPTTSIAINDSAQLGGQLAGNLHHGQQQLHPPQQPQTWAEQSLKEEMLQLSVRVDLLEQRLSPVDDTVRMVDFQTLSEQLKSFAARLQPMQDKIASLDAAMKRIEIRSTREEISGLLMSSLPTGHIPQKDSSARVCVGTNLMMPTSMYGDTQQLPIGVDSAPIIHPTDILKLRCIQKPSQTSGSSSSSLHELEIVVPNAETMSSDSTESQLENSASVMAGSSWLVDEAFPFISQVENIGSVNSNFVVDLDVQYQDSLALEQHLG